jgi:DNA-binding NarL/FixJ family response regulator
MTNIEFDNTQRPGRITVAPAAAAALAATLRQQAHARRGVAAPDGPLRVVVADDHALFRGALRALLKTVDGIAVVGEAADGAEALAAAARLAPDVLLLDVEMPGLNGADALRDIRANAPGVPVLMLTVHPERDLLLPMLEMGAAGYLTKDASIQELIDAIRVVAGGEIYVRPSAARALASAVASHLPDDSPRGQFNALSPREQATVRLIAEGFSGTEIAHRLGISTKTVDAYKRRVQDKLGLSHRTDYVRFAIAANVLSASMTDSGEHSAKQAPRGDGRDGRERLDRHDRDDRHDHHDRHDHRDGSASIDASR